MSAQEPSVQAETTRRRFLALATSTLAFLGVLGLGIPLGDALVGPALRLKKRHFARVAEINSFPTEQPIDAAYPDQTEDAYIHETTLRSVWVVKHSLAQVTVFSPICPHLGCQYNWDPQSRHFECPCHNSVFALDGKVLGGPAPRPLDTLPIKIENGELLVEWERFKPGIPEKVPV